MGWLSTKWCRCLAVKLVYPKPPIHGEWVEIKRGDPINLLINLSDESPGTPLKSAAVPSPTYVEQAKAYSPLLPEMELRDVAFPTGLCSNVPCDGFHFRHVPEMEVGDVAGPFELSNALWNGAHVLKMELQNADFPCRLPRRARSRNSAPCRRCTSGSRTLARLPRSALRCS